MTETLRMARSSRLVYQGSRTLVARRNALTVQRPNSFAAWLIMIATFLPPVQISIADVYFTPGRAAVFLLFVPAVGRLFKPGRSCLPSDFFAVATGSWMIVASLLNGGFRPVVVAEAVEFVGAYLIGRAFFFGCSGLELFIRVIKVVACVVIALGFVDTLSGFPVTMHLMGLADPLKEVATGYRFGLVRANSTIQGGELFGTFCVAVTALFLYSERTLAKQIFYVGLGIFGSLISLSSGPLLGLTMVFAVFYYNSIFKRVRSRWSLLGLAFLCIMVIAFLVLNDPIGAIVRHLTLDPSTGYFRVMTWTLGLNDVALHPILGRGMTPFEGAPSDMFFLKSVDAVWLLEMIRYGAPMLLLLLLTIFLPMFKPNRISSADPYLNDMRVGFTLTIITMSFIGLTVHFWNTIWIFLALCIGVRASFVELEAGPLRRSHPRRKLLDSSS